MKNWFKQRKKGLLRLFYCYAIVLPLITILFTSFAIILVFNSIEESIEESEQTFITLMYHEGIGAAIIRENKPEDPNPQIIDIPSVEINRETFNTTTTYYFSVYLINMTNDYHNIWMKVYIPKVVYDSFGSITAIWTAINNKGQEESGIFTKQDFEPATRPFTGYIASVNYDFERVVWRILYTGPITVKVVLI